MTLELYRPGPDGEVITLMLWRKGDVLADRISEYCALLVRRGLQRFTPHRAVVRGPHGGIMGQWRLATAKSA